MNNDPSISILLDQRNTATAKMTADIIAKFSGRLTQAFQRVFNQPSNAIFWTAIEHITGSTKSVMVTGFMTLNVGETIKIGDKEILLDETNVNEYNKLIKFAFPLILLELATVDEMVEHIQRLSKLGSLLELTPDELSKAVDKTADEYQEKLLNDPTKLDAVTKPENVWGFSTTELSDSQILQLKIFETDELRTIN